MNHINKWLKSAAGKMSIFLFLVSAILIIIALSGWIKLWFSETEVDNINNIVIGIATNLIGIIVTVTFVQYFIDKQNEVMEREEEKKKILRYNRYMELLIRRYLTMYLSLTTRLEDRNEFDIETVFDRKFEFSDLADMYKTTLILSEKFLEPTISLFFDAENNMRDYMLRMVENIEFKYFQELSEVLLSFVVETSDLDMSRQILGNMNVYSGKDDNGNSRPLSEQIGEYIANEDKYDWLGQFEMNELQGNMMLPYVIFYYTLQDRIKLMKKYTCCIEKL